MELVGGMDGCRDGWVLVTAPLDGGGESTVDLVPDLSAVVPLVDSGRLSAVAIDIPIGLPEVGPRECDGLARKMIGQRASSVFPAPARSLIASETYSEVCDRNEALCGKKVSKQSFALFPKIAAVDEVMTPERQSTLVEVHPELSFRMLAGAPLTYYKRTPEGWSERLRWLRPVFPDLEAHAMVRIPRVGLDDVLDAYAACWTARRWVKREHVQLGGQLDGRGLRMEMIA